MDLLARLAVTKFLRAEMNLQFSQVLERCRVLIKSYDNMRQGKAHEYRERLATFQVRKRIILRKAGQEIFETLREVEKSTLARTRRSLFGEETSGGSYFTYPLFLNRLLFSEDGRDDYLCAEYYVMLGNWDRDPDRYGRMREIASIFLRSQYGEEVSTETLDSWMNVPENARALVGTGTPEDSDEGLAQQERLAEWVRLLEDERVMENVIASYHVVPLLGEYAPRINAQQLKNALIDRTECDRVERMIQEGRLSPNSLYARGGQGRQLPRGRAGEGGCAVPGRLLPLSPRPAAARDVERGFGFREPGGQRAVAGTVAGERDALRVSASRRAGRNRFG